MTKTILTALAVMFALSAPAFASITSGISKGAVYQEEGGAPQCGGEGQPACEGGEGGGGGGGGD